MKVLVIGSGGRCHAIVKGLSNSKNVDRIFAAPGNAGMAKLATLVPIKDTDIIALVAFAKDNFIGLTVVGPEVSLAAGVVDAFNEAKLPIFGPTKAAAQIESSKDFAKKLMVKYDIPTAKYQTFTNYDEAILYVKANSFPTVLKYDGLAAGKGVIIANDFSEAEEALKDMLLDDKFGEGKVVIEECLTGPEFSFMCFVDNESVYPLEMAQDHKRAYDNDLGPNTGGMGAYSPLPFIKEEDKQYAYNNIMVPTAKALVKEGCPFKGVLYGGLMKTPNGIKVIEFNARFGDPETEVVLPRLTSDLCEAFMAIVNGTVPVLTWDTDYTIGIVLASKGYPMKYEKHVLIENVPNEGVFHMGTKMEDGKLYTDGGRVLFCIGKGRTLEEANKKALKIVREIKCDNLFYRTDIGAKAYKEQ